MQSGHGKRIIGGHSGGTSEPGTGSQKGVPAMSMPHEQVMRLGREAREGLAAIYGERLKRVYLFGSHARGDAREGSDIDVAVVLGGPVDRWEERDRTNDLLSELSLREDCLMSAVFVSDEELEAAPYAIHRSILREGVLV